MTTKKQLETRRQINQRLGVEDSARRCTFCKKSLHIGYLMVITPGGDALKYCNQDCQMDAADALHALETRR